jgi:methylaspartate ammonia-lyase
MLPMIVLLLLNSGCVNGRTLHDAVEYGVVIVALHAELQEVAACQRRLLAPEFNVNVSVRRDKQHLAVQLE